MWLKAREEIQKASQSSSIYIGCDSLIVRVKDIQYADYSTVIVLHRDSNKGCKLFHNVVRIRDYGNMRNRLLTEVQHAIEAFYAVEDILGSRNFEVHLDINSNEKHASNIVSSEALGWVRGLGIKAKIKPDSFAATTAADHCVRHHNKIS
jgi:predicted RNase H-related nuclease YkuK (DUF458 family)